MRHLLSAFILFLSLTATAFAETIDVGVDGMVCAFCAKGIEEQFGKNENVGTIKVDLDKKLVTLTTKGDATLTDAEIKKVIDWAGYSVSGISRRK
jgi:copper chaperone CopZ